MSEFCVVLVSNASSDIHEENSLTNFTNICPHILSLNGNWQVALQTISFTNNLTNLPRSCAVRDIGHFAFVPDGTNPKEKQVKIKLIDTFFTPSSLQVYLQRNIPRAYDKNVTVVLEENQNLTIVLNNCVAYIHEAICQWMKISITGRPKVTFNGHVYVQFNSQKSNLKIASPTSTYGSEYIPSFVKLQLKEMRPTISGNGYHQDLAVIPYTTPKEGHTILPRD